jgi:predicted nucleic acid-binding protein
MWLKQPIASQVPVQLEAARSQGPLLICAPVYLELLAHPGISQRIVDHFLAETDIAVDFDMNETVWRNAAKPYIAYTIRRRASGGGHSKRLLVDFLVGAHAQVSADRLFTLDKNRYARDFPNLDLM